MKEALVYGSTASLSKHVLDCRLINGLDAASPIEASEYDLARANRPKTLSPDQATQLTRFAFTSRTLGRPPNFDVRHRPLHIQPLHQANVTPTQVEGQISATDRRRIQRLVSDRQLSQIIYTMSRGRSRRLTDELSPRPTVATRPSIQPVKRCRAYPHPYMCTWIIESMGLKHVREFPKCVTPHQILYPNWRRHPKAYCL